MWRRLLLGVGANTFGQIINIVIQVFSLPLFLLVWDVSTYGTWLLLSALPGYLGMADIGVASVAGNKMTMAVAREDYREANTVYQSAQAFMVIVCGGLAALLVPAALFWPASGDYGADIRIALAALLLGVLVGLLGGLGDAVFKATHRFAVGTMLGHMARLTEWGGFMLGLVMFRSFAGVAIVGLLARVVATIAIILMAQRGQEGLHLGFRQSSRVEFGRMLHPAVSFMAFPLANALTFQGVTLLVGALAGPSSVALFNAYRTIARVAVQLTSVFSLALWPEFSRLFGRLGMVGVRPLYRRSALIGSILAVVFSPVIFVASPWLLSIWTHGRIAFEPTLMVLLLVYAAIGGIWHVPRVLLMSTNRHVGLSVWSLAAGTLCVALGWALGRVFELNGVGAAMLLSELFVAGICIHLANRSFAEAT